MPVWRCQGCPASYGAWLSRCPRCGSSEELVMALSVCTGCTTKYAVGLSKCPQCGSTDHVEDGQPMPKITEHGGPSSVTAGPDEPGYMPPVDEVPEAKQVVEATEPEGGEESSPGSSSSASTPATQTKPEPSETPSPLPVRKTASRSKKAPTDSSSATSTDGEKTAPTSDSDTAK